MSRWPCVPKGTCVPRALPTTVVSSEGTFHYWYCIFCGHVVKAKRIR